jgi:hypothetical protein
LQHREDEFRRSSKCLSKERKTGKSKRFEHKEKNSFSVIKNGLRANTVIIKTENSFSTSFLRLCFLLVKKGDGAGFIFSPIDFNKTYLLD